MLPPGRRGESDTDTTARLGELYSCRLLLPIDRAVTTHSGRSRGSTSHVSRDGVRLWDRRLVRRTAVRSRIADNEARILAVIYRGAIPHVGRLAWRPLVRLARTARSPIGVVLVPAQWGATRVMRTWSPVDVSVGVRLKAEHVCVQLKAEHVCMPLKAEHVCMRPVHERMRSTYALHAPPCAAQCRPAPPPPPRHLASRGGTRRARRTVAGLASLALRAREAARPARTCSRRRAHSGNRTDAATCWRRTSCRAGR